MLDTATLQARIANKEFALLSLGDEHATRVMLAHDDQKNDTRDAFRFAPFSIHHDNAVKALRHRGAAVVHVGDYLLRSRAFDKLGGGVGMEEIRALSRPFFYNTEDLTIRHVSRGMSMRHRRKNERYAAHHFQHDVKDGDHIYYKKDLSALADYDALCGVLKKEGITTLGLVGGMLESDLLATVESATQKPCKFDLVVFTDAVLSATLPKDEEENRTLCGKLLRPFFDNLTLTSLSVFCAAADKPKDPLAIV